MRGYSSILEKTLIDSRIKKETLDAMLSAMVDSLPDFAKFLRKKAEVLGHSNGLPFYDLFAPVGEANLTFTEEEAKEFILKNFYSFSQNLGDMAKKAFEEKLNSQFGIKSVKGDLIKIGQERIFLFQGKLNPSQLLELNKNLPVERIGVYFAKEEESKSGEIKIRLSIEGAQILKDQITKNEFELDEEQTDQWMKGHVLNLKTGKNDFLIITHKEDLLS